MDLRPYQTECVDHVLQAYKSFKEAKDTEQLQYLRSQFLVLPTGAGKTIIFSYIVRALFTKYGINALVIAHRDELLDQATEKYRMIKPDAIIGKVGSGLFQYGGEVTVASVATISRPEHLKKLKAIGYGIIIIDECHHSASSSYQAVLKTLPDSFVLGVTATPDRLDKKNILGGKKPLYTASIIDMIRDGYLCNFRAVAIQTEITLDELHTQMGDFNEKELDLAVNTPARNALIVRKYQELAGGRRTVAFCVTVAHATALAYAFNENGINAAIITGNTSLDERKRIYTDFHDGKILVLSNVMVLTEGWDEPLCEVAIMARPTQSRSLYLQQFGRILRPLPGKVALLLDITDNCTKHKLLPQNLRKAIEKQIKDNESINDALEREKEEQQTEKEAIVRKLPEKRVRDIQINLLETLEWQKRDDGIYMLEVGQAKHRIALHPSKWEELYFVAARLAPDFAAQRWSMDCALEDAQQIAEKKIRLLLDDPKNKVLVDKNAQWRIQKINPESNQGKMLRWFQIPFGDGTNIKTKGEASDAIEAHKEEIAKKKAVAAARKAAKKKETVTYK